MSPTSRESAERDGSVGDLGIASEWEKPHKMLKQQKDKGRGEMGTRFVAGLDRSHVFSLSQTKSLELLRILKIPANGHTEACRLCGRPPECRGEGGTAPLFGSRGLFTITNRRVRPTCRTPHKLTHGSQPRRSSHSHHGPGARALSSLFYRWKT